MYAPEALLLRRQTTPAVSASWRSVAVTTPPTLPVLQSAALGGSGPCWSGQLKSDVHCPPVTLQWPTGGHSPFVPPNVAPGVLQTPSGVQSQAAFVMVHTPGLFGQE